MRDDDDLVRRIGLRRAGEIDRHALQPIVEDGIARANIPARKNPGVEQQAEEEPAIRRIKQRQENADPCADTSQ
ncbi:hypothetical protein D3C87_2064420 [compost metagenome]